MLYKDITAIIMLLPLLAFSQYAENDWDERNTWMNVFAIFDISNIQYGSHVADIGCHEGYLSIHLARKVGKGGRVYAVDVRNDRLEVLKKNLEDRALFNVDVILGDYDNPKLPQNKLDVVVIMDTYHEMTDYMTILNHAKNALKPGGRIVIIEKLKSRIKDKTREEQTNAHSLGIRYVKQELKDAGFKLKYENDDLGDWENDPDKVIWMVVATKPK
ncbi:MAG: class I SAM-dependent methyltransferase [Flavobacteriaceae bacterium]|nr:class I SAM-dependent methyltransferase [Flavobacteriaceae bacterium]